MTRRLLNLVTALSLLLCVAVVALWATSYLFQPTVAWTEPQRLAGVGVTRGVVFFTEVRQPPGSLARFGPPYGRRFVAVRPPPRRFSRAR